MGGREKMRTGEQRVKVWPFSEHFKQLAL